MSADLHADLADLARADRLLVVLDFDGTISHMVPVPSDARPAPGALEVIARLDGDPDTDVVLLSGRARGDLAEVSGAAGVAGLIGSHGQEHDEDVALSDEEATLLDGLRQEVSSAVAGIAGIRIEHKPAGLAVHVRGASDVEGQHATELVREIAHRDPGTYSLEGKLVVEISVRPMDKGSALSALIAGEPGRRVLFAGDDVTDETAMAVLRPQDVSIRVGPGESLARHRLAGPTEMVRALELLAELRSTGPGPAAT